MSLKDEVRYVDEFNLEIRKEAHGEPVAVVPLSKLQEFKKVIDKEKKFATDQLKSCRCKTLRGNYCLDCEKEMSKGDIIFYVEEFFGGLE